MDNKELDHQQEELQLLPSPYHDHNDKSPSYTELYKPKIYFEAPPSLDLQLSSCCNQTEVWHTSEQIRLGAILEKEYVERVKDLTRREMEMAQSEFSKAKIMWERAKEEVQEAERLKLKATRWINSNCIEITCQSCRQKFQSPSF